MHTLISHLFYRTKGDAIKLLSSENGRIKLQTFEDVTIYAHTQGIFYFLYQNSRQYAEYYLQLAELMRGENRNGWAAHCYLKAFNEVWRVYENITKHGSCYGEENPNGIDPYNLYETIRLYMLEMGNTGGLKRLKEIHRKRREYDYIESKYTLLSRRREREKSIEELLDRDFDLDNYDCNYDCD